jgi:predicted YcjX-like family ATPase
MESPEISGELGRIGDSVTPSRKPLVSAAVTPHLCALERNRVVKFSDIVDGSRIAAGGLRDFAAGLAHPTVRLGVTGLARSGKTVFVTALIHALLNDGKLPLFEPRGRITRTYLEPQPDDDLPRFAYEDHVAALTGIERTWPESTKRLSQLRLTIDYTPRGFLSRQFGSGRLHIDIVDYPGEWLLDLPLMTMSYAEWSYATIAQSRTGSRVAHAGAWHGHLKALDPVAPHDETVARRAAEIFTAYLAACRNSDSALSALPPGRFLMPGDLASSPLLTYAPLDIDPHSEFPRNSLGAAMARRYDSYVSKVVKPFFFGHFARLDRQIVLVDALSALNAGADAVADLSTVITSILSCFRQGSNNWASALFGKRIDRILFAASKADLLHHGGHDKLEKILDRIVATAAAKAEFAGAEVSTVALAAIRATREATVKRKNEELPCITGIPEQGEKIGDTEFDGMREAAVFPGDLPDDPARALSGDLHGALHFVKFRSPRLVNGNFPFIRLDRAVDFLIGDRLS